MHSKEVQEALQEPDLALVREGDNGLSIIEQ